MLLFVTNTGKPVCIAPVNLVGAALPLPPWNFNAKSSTNNWSKLLYRLPCRLVNFQILAEPSCNCHGIYFLNESPFPRHRNCWPLGRRKNSIQTVFAFAHCVERASDYRQFRPAISISLSFFFARDNQGKIVRFRFWMNWRRGCI